LPPFWSFSQSEVYNRKPYTIDEVMEMVEDMTELLDEDMIHSAGKRTEICIEAKRSNFQQLM
jgi:hypothetical protein